LAFQKWTKINVQNRKPKILFQTRFLPFLYILFLNLLKEIYQSKLLWLPF
jgi:hypothetical protein